MRTFSIEMTVITDDDTNEDTLANDLESSVGFISGVDSVSIDYISEPSRSVPDDVRVVCHAVGCGAEMEYDDEFLDEVDSYYSMVDYIRNHPESGWEVSEEPGVTRGKTYCPLHSIRKW